MISHINHKRTLLYKASLLITFMLGLCSFFPPLRSLIFFNELWVVFLISWLLFTFLNNPNFFLKPNKHRRLVYLYFILTVGVAYVSGNNVIGNRYLELFLIPLFYMAYENNKQSGSNHDNLLILKFTAPFILITSFLTFQALLINPYASRSIKISQNLGKVSSSLGIGGFELIYFLVIVYTILLFFIYFNFKIKNVTITIITFLLFATIILSNFSTALFLIFIGSIIRVFFNRIYYSRIVFIITLLLIFSVFYQHIIYFFIDNLILINFGDGKNTETLLEVKNYLLDSQSGGAIIGRNETFSHSIQLILENPFLGIINNPISTNIQGQITGFGQHSLILDTFALFGIFTIVLQLYILFQPLLIRLKYNNKFISGFALAILFVFLIQVTINNATPSIGFATFFIYPTLYDLYLKRKINK
jgi:hypothetical protein